MKFLPFLILLGVSSVFAQQPVQLTFNYTSSKAKAVSVAGSFNNWDASANPMTRQNDSLWSLTVSVPAGYYYYKIVVDGSWGPDPVNPKRVNDGGESFNSIIRAGNPPIPKRPTSSRPFPKDQLPRPVLSNQDFIDLYYAAWQMAWNKVAKGTPENGFSESYMDEGFNELIYQWDTNFIVAFAMYAPEVFPAMPSLDNFYIKQDTTGYIQRVYWESNGKIANTPSEDEPMVNPPLFAWLELRYYELTGDGSRLKRVLPHLVKYYEWIDNNLRKTGRGLYYNTPLGSGMDNTPRRGVNKAGWVDFSAQQALAAKSISRISAILKEHSLEERFKKNYQSVSSLINSLCWDNKKAFYYDLKEDGTLSPTKHIGGYWTMLSETLPKKNADAFTGHLTNPSEFYRRHLVPTLSADDPDYDPKGHYWLGSIWAPTNYMTVKGLERYGYYALADEIAENHITNMSTIYKGFDVDEEKIAYEERYADGYRTIWECYAPDTALPATRWDNTYYSRQNFVGWSGLGPIAMLIENVLGFELHGTTNTIKWRIHRGDTHGIENLSFCGDKISLVCRPVKGGLEITSKAAKNHSLEILYKGKVYSRTIMPGEKKIIIR